MPASSTMKRSFAADATSLRDVREFVRERADEAWLVPSESDDLVQAVSEVCANAVLHASGEMFDVSFSTGPGGVRVEVRDRGVFSPSPGTLNRGRVGGFGLPLVTALVDEISIRGGTPSRPGTTVALVKNRSPEF